MQLLPGKRGARLITRAPESRLQAWITCAFHPLPVWIAPCSLASIATLCYTPCCGLLPAFAVGFVVVAGAVAACFPAVAGVAAVAVVAFPRSLSAVAASAAASDIADPVSVGAVEFPVGAFVPTAGCTLVAVLDGKKAADPDSL